MSSVTPPGESQIDPAVKDIDPVGFALDRARTYVHWIEEHWASFEAARESDPEAAERELAHLAHSAHEARLHLARRWSYSWRVTPSTRRSACRVGYKG
jgi:hypothetical protein